MAPGLIGELLPASGAFRHPFASGRRGGRAAFRLRRPGLQRKGGGEQGGERDGGPGGGAFSAPVTERRHGKKRGQGAQPPGPPRR